MLTTVWEGPDYGLIPELIDLHWTSRVGAERVPVIVDCNWGKGRFWRGTTWDVIGIDRDPARAKTILADNTAPPLAPSTVDILVYDPPHMADPGPPRFKILGEKAYSVAWGYNNLKDYMAPFVAEAGRVLRPQGVLIAKIADDIHNGRLWWQMVSLVNLLQDSAVLTPCDCVVKVRSSPGPVSPTWQRQLHARRRHSYFLVARKGGC